MLGTNSCLRSKFLSLGYPLRFSKKGKCEKIAEKRRNARSRKCCDRMHRSGNGMSGARIHRQAVNRINSVLLSRVLSFTIALTSAKMEYTSASLFAKQIRFAFSYNVVRILFQVQKNNSFFGEKNSKK